MEDFVKCVVYPIAIIIGIFIGMFAGIYNIKVACSPEIVVYVDNVKVYEGNAYFCQTASRGQGTIVQIYEKGWFAPDMKYEYLSNNVKIVTK